MPSVVARYREFEPCAELRPYVRAIFTFVAPPNDARHERFDHGRRIKREIVRREGDPYWSALFADGHVSLVFYSGTGHRIDGIWDPPAGAPRTHIIGAMSRAHGTSPGERLVQVGAYFRAGQASLFMAAPADEFTDRAVALENFWGTAASELEDQLGGADADSVRVNVLESALLRRVAPWPGSSATLDLPGLASLARRRPGRLTVESMADLAGVSRQYLTRIFREGVGVTPKLYCRLSRFRAALILARQVEHVDWADLAIVAGYADQTHMIAEFREFSGMTPGMFRRERSFHPFAEHPGTDVP